jgi:hypothetical protein
MKGGNKGETEMTTMHHGMAIGSGSKEGGDSGLMKIIRMISGIDAIRSVKKCHELICETREEIRKIDKQ